MNIYWWHDGLHIRPANDREWDALSKLCDALEEEGLRFEDTLDRWGPPEAVERDAVDGEFEVESVK